MPFGTITGFLLAFAALWNFIICCNIVRHYCKISVPPHGLKILFFSIGIINIPIDHAQRNQTATKLYGHYVREKHE